MKINYVIRLSPKRNISNQLSVLNIVATLVGSALGCGIAFYLGTRQTTVTGMDNIIKYSQKIENNDSIKRTHELNKNIYDLMVESESIDFALSHGGGEDRPVFWDENRRCNVLNKVISLIDEERQNPLLYSNFGLYRELMDARTTASIYSILPTNPKRMLIVNGSTDERRIGAAKDIKDSRDTSFIHIYKKISEKTGKVRDFADSLYKIEHGPSLQK